MVHLLYHDGTVSVPSWFFNFAASVTLQNFTSKPQKIGLSSLTDCIVYFVPASWRWLFAWAFLRGLIFPTRGFLLKTYDLRLTTNSYLFGYNYTFWGYKYTF